MGMFGLFRKVNTSHRVFCMRFQFEDYHDSGTVYSAKACERMACSRPDVPYGSYGSG